jgi:pimeloyl-ACP methyl ester carboxylesterase
MSLEPLLEEETKTPVVFVHGLWVHGESWRPWVELFRRNGYDAVAAKWPGEADTPEATRRNGAAMAGYGLSEITDFITGQLSLFDDKPVLIGHSFGGLIVQNLLGRGLGAAAVAIDAPPFKGISDLPLSMMKSNKPVLRNPLNYKRAVTLSEPEFRSGFASAVSEKEARELYARFSIPGPAKPVFQTIASRFTPRSAAKVDTRNAKRGPLLLMAGAADHTVPPVMVKGAVRAYRKSRAITDFKEFPNRGHSLVMDHGWRELAEYTLNWLHAKGF